MAHPELQRPIRVVMFGSGPRMTYDARQFLVRLESEPEIQLLGAFCQAESTSARGVWRDLRKRRGILALPLFTVWLGKGLLRWAKNPRAQLSLRRDLERISDRIHFVVDIHAADVLDRVRALEPDLGLIYGSPILKPDLFEIPPLGTLGIHHGKVPEYRGNKTTFWAMYNGEEAAGVTIQKIDAGLDTGLIAKEGSVPIGRRTQRSVWKELEDLGLDLYLETILDVRHGRATFRPQTGPRGKLYRNPKLGDLLRFHALQLRRRLGRLAAPTPRPGKSPASDDDGNPSGNGDSGAPVT